MAVIRQIQSTQGLDSGAGSRPSTRVDDSFGRGLQQAGNALLAAGADFHEMDLRRERMKLQNQEFRTGEAFDRFKGDFAADYAKLATEMDPSGEGFTEGVAKRFGTSSQKFLQSVPDALKPKFTELIATTRETFLNRAAAAETDQRTGWFRKGVLDTQERLAGQVVEDPSVYAAALSEGYRKIEESGLPEVEKQALREAWPEALQEAKAANYVRTRAPELIGLTSEAPAGRMIRAIAQVESEDRADAISPKGAVGLMQVMPDTGREIADELNDPNFPRTGTAADVRAYLSDPKVSTVYGTHYFARQLARFDGDVKAALIAYNGGPERAEEWLNSGRDDSVLPEETRAYVPKVLKAFGQAQDAAFNGAEIPVKAKSGINVSNVDPVVLGRWQRVQNLFGRQIEISSGFRDPNYNRRVGGARHSQHLHGNAIDIDVSGLSEDERVELIRIASATGFSGVGVYKNSLHLDLGPRRAWGSNYHADSVPGWASEAIGEHMAGRAAPQAGRDGGQQGTLFLHPEFADLPLARRIAIYDKALAAVQSQQKAAEASQKAAYTEHKDAFSLGIEAGAVTSESQILDDARLDDGDKATLLRRYREVSKDRRESADLISAIAAGDAEARLNPFDADDRKRGEKAFEAIRDSLEPEQMEAATRAFVEATGYVPESTVAAFRHDFNSRNPADVVRAFVEADWLDATLGRNLGGITTGAEIAEAATTFRHLTGRLGMTPDQAARRVIDMRDPDKRREREALLETKAVKDKLKKTGSGDVAAIFDAGLFDLAPKVGESPQAEAAMVADYRAMLEESIVDAAGDMDLAEDLAAERFRRIYGVSSLTVQGEDVVQKFPPETVYPAGPDGTHGYIRDQAREALSQEGVEAGTIFLQPYEGTAADVAAGRPPRYQLIYEQDGEQHTFNLPFYAMPEAGPPVARDFEQNRERVRRNRARELERQAIIETGKPSMTPLQEMGAAVRRSQGEGLIPPSRLTPVAPVTSNGVPVVDRETIRGQIAETLRMQPVERGRF